MEDRRWFDLNPRKFRVGWIEQEVMLPHDHERRHLEDGTRTGIEPPVAQLFGAQATLEVCLVMCTRFSSTAKAMLSAI